MYVAYSTLFPVGRQRKFGPDRIIVEVSRSHTIRHTQLVALRCTSDQLVAEDATYTTRNNHNRRKSMLSAGLEPAIPAIERPQVYALDRADAGGGTKVRYPCWQCAQHTAVHNSHCAQKHVSGTLVEFWAPAWSYGYCGSTGDMCRLSRHNEVQIV
jgi:hypothetical protein